jgi:hypothetical protein
VSHQRERKEKNCLNCGTTVIDRYCHHCGQENVETRESFLSLARHFIYDILHFDGGFFITMKYLFIRPGFVARQYAEGKRMTYLHPIRMYLFTSAVFFLVFFATETFHVTPAKNADKKDRLELADALEARVKPDDAVLKRKIALLRDTSQPVDVDTMNLNSISFFSVSARNYKSIHEYDSVQRSLPKGKKDGWFQRIMTRRTIEVNEKYRNENEGTTTFLKIFQHNLPYMLFLSLPFFALILKLLYIRRKNFYYSDHATFTLYHYVFSFILLLIVFGAGYLKDVSDLGIFTFLQAAMMIFWPIYLLKEMKHFYRQGWGKTLGKFLLLNLLGITVLIVLFILFMFFSIFQM